MLLNFVICRKELTTMHKPNRLNTTQYNKALNIYYGIIIDILHKLIITSFNI